MRNTHLIVFFVTANFLSGCVIPYPHFKQTCCAINGKVVEEGSKIPIKNVQVNTLYPDGGTQTTYTDISGKFHLKAKNRFYWGVLFGVALNHSLPLDDGPCCFVHGFSKIEFIKNGYIPTHIYPAYNFSQLPPPSDINVQYLEIKQLYDDNGSAFQEVLLIPK